MIIDWFICDPWKTEIGVIRDLLFHIGILADWQKGFSHFKQDINLKKIKNKKETFLLVYAKITIYFKI